MRWQQLSISECIEHGDWSAVWTRVSLLPGITACVLAAATLLFAATPAPAAGDEIVAGGEVSQVAEAPERGMPATNPRVKSLLASHPNEFVTICVAGCGKPTIVQMLPKPSERRVGAMRTTAGGADQGRPHPSYDAADRDAVLCVAGCGGRTGEVVQRMPELPPLKVAPHATEGRGNEPLDR